MPCCEIESVEELCGEIRQKAYPHVAFLAGSAVSFGHPSGCAGVKTIRDELILEVLRAHWRGNHELVFLADQMLGRCRAGDASHAEETRSLRRNVLGLPFEQFVGCLHAANACVADGIVDLACGPRYHPEPNVNHHLIALIAEALLGRGYCRTITIFTTNFDVCLEAALLQRLQGHASWETLVPHVPVLRWQLPNGKRLRLVKLHGCLSGRADPVYTMERMLPRIFHGELLDVLTNFGERPDLCIAVGYAFLDPDLRPMLRQALRSCKTIWNERAKATERQMLTPPTIAEWLRQEFLDDLTICIYRSDLCHYEDSVGNRHILASMAEDLEGSSGEIERLCGALAAGGIEQPLNPKIQDAARDVLSTRLSLDQTCDFLSAVVDSFSRGEAKKLLKQRVLSRPRAGAPHRLIRRYLEQAGHTADYDDVYAACVEVRQHFRDVQTRALSYSYESFIAAIREDTQIIRAIYALARSRLAFPWWRRKAIRWFCGHLEAHFWAKVVEHLPTKLPTPIYRASTWLFRAAALVIALWQKRLDRQAKERGWILDIGRVEDELSQMLVVGCRQREAIKVAEEMSLRESAIGAYNLVVLADRVLGWAYLAMNEEDSRARAISVFARGFWRSVFSEDPTLRPKLVSNLVRALLVEGVEMPALACPMGVKSPEHEEVIRASQRLCLEGQLHAEDADVVARDMLSAYPANERGRIIEHLRRYSDVTRYPIFLPPMPPRRWDDGTEVASRLRGESA